MRQVWVTGWLFLLVSLGLGQTKRLWVLQPSGEMVEYDPTNFAAGLRVKVPVEATQSPQNILVNRQGQILFVPTLSLPLADSDLQTAHKAWLWNGQTANALDLNVKHDAAKTGSNQAVTDTIATILLSEDANHLFWSANQQRRLQREEIDLSATTTWQAWRTDLTGAGREDIASVKFPDCTCSTGACEESCPEGMVWAPVDGIKNFFVLTEFIPGKDEPAYKASTIFREQDRKWSEITTPETLKRMLDATSNGDSIVDAIPDTGCCGWSNQSDDQTLVLANGKSTVIFDEQASFKNADYDVSFYTSDAHLAPDLKSVAMTIVATAAANQPIQLSEQGQANPEESKQIRKALIDIPAVEVKTVEDNPRRIALLPHAQLVGWFSDKELLIVEDHSLVVYDVMKGARRKTGVRAEDVAHVFLR